MDLLLPVDLPFGALKPEELGSTLMDLLGVQELTIDAATLMKVTDHEEKIA